MSEALVLRVESGPQRGRSIDLSALSGRWTLGSDPSADIVLQGEGVAARHVELGRLKDGSLGVRAIAPARAQLGGTPFEAARWSVGETLELGSLALALVPAAAKAAAEPARPASAPAASSGSGSASSPGAGSGAGSGGGAGAGGGAGSAADPLVGREIGGYRLLSRLGSGGMGTVYRALQVSLQREVALKLLSPELCAEPGFVEQFQREARAAGQLNHPNIVQVYDVGQDGPHHFYSMELIPHGSLETKLRREGQLPWREALKAARDAAHGLEYAESKRIVHRDIKPDNLMLGERGVVKIADLGLAGRHEEDDQERGVLGTPHFMSPEQAQGLSVDGRGDIYSLGATLYRILSGRTPFSGRTVKEIVRAQIQDEPTPLTEIVEGLPPRVAALVERMMRKDPAQRFASAAELVAEITAAIADAGATEKRGSARGVLLVAALAVVGVGAWLALGRGGGADEGTADPARSAAQGPRPTDGPPAEQGSPGSNASPTGAGDPPVAPSQSNAPSATELEMRRKLREANAQLARNAAEALSGPRAERLEAWRRVATEFSGTEAARFAAERTRELEAEQTALANAIAAVEKGDPAALERRDWSAALRAITAPVDGVLPALQADPELADAVQRAAAAVGERAESATRDAVRALAAPTDLPGLDAARAKLAELERELALDAALPPALSAPIATRFEALRAELGERRTRLEKEARALGAARREAERLALWRSLDAAANAALAHAYGEAARALESSAASIAEDDHASLAASRVRELELADAGWRALASYLATPERKPLQIEHPDGKGKVFVARLERDQLLLQKKRDETPQAVPLLALDSTAELLALCEPLLGASGSEAAGVGALLALETSARGALLAREAIAAALKGDEQAGAVAADWFQPGYEAAQRLLASAAAAPEAATAGALLERERAAATELVDALRALAEGRFGAADAALARLESSARSSWIFALLSEGRAALGEAAR